jgi:hypothetical protein
VEDPALCELLNRDVASLVGVNFRNKSLVSCAYCFYLVLVDLEFVLCRSTYSSCCACKVHLQKSPSITTQPLIQPGFVISSLLLNFAKRTSCRRKFRFSVRSSGPSELPAQCWKFRQI